MTFLKCKQIAEHALGGAPDSRISKGYLVNQAISYLYDAYPWSWKRKIASLASVANTATIALPADMETIEAIEGPAGSSLRVQRIEAAELLALIRNNTSYPDRLFVALIGGDATSLYQMQLRVYPVPTASVAGYLTLAYSATFTRFTEDDTSTADDAKLAPLPIAFRDVLVDLLRAKAQSEEIDPTNPHWQLVTQRLEMLVAKDRRLVHPVEGTIQTTQRQMMGDGDVLSNLYPVGEPVWTE